MKKSLFPVLALAGALAVLAPLASAQAQTQPKQFVVLVAEGTSPTVLEMGKGYLRKANEDADLSTSFDSLMETGKSASVSTSSLTDMAGVLATAEKSGFKTGIITTSDVTKVAPLFYGNLATAMAQADFVAGGGRASIGEAGNALKAAGGTFINDADGLAEETKGRVLAVQADGDLSFALDRQPETEGGLSELATLAMDTLAQSPYVLVIHDTLIKKAIDTKDSPALFEQFREINSILGDAISRRDDNSNFNVAALLTGGATPQFASGANADAAYFTLSTLTKSFSGVGTALKGADLETVNAFIDANEGDYRGWKLSSEQKARIVAGTLNAETAARAAYEPVLKLNFDGATAAPVAYATFDAPQGLVAAVKSAVASSAK